MRSSRVVADSPTGTSTTATQIEGFATDMSVNAGTRVDFKINVNGGAGSDYKVEIFRLGYYGGSGAREVAEWTNTNATVQPDALFDASRGMVDAGNWSVTDSWNVPADAVSGVYLARLQRLDANGNPIDGAVNQIPFIVRNDGEQPRHRPADLRHDLAGLQRLGRQQRRRSAPTSTATRTARINWDPIPGAGRISQDRAYAVSYNRPFITDDGTGPASGAQDYLFGADYAAIYWLEKKGYDVSYISGVDTDRLGADYLKNYKSFISVGHDEYWSGDQRANVEEARDAGVNLLFWSGNEVYWKTRWEVAYQRRRHGVPHARLLQGDARGRRPQRRPGGLLQPRPERTSGPARGWTRASTAIRSPAAATPRTWTRSPASTPPATAARTS